MLVYGLYRMFFEVEMPSPSLWIKQVYRLILPASMRSSKVVSRVKKLIVNSQLFPHDMIYDEDYYSNVIEAAANRSSEVMAQSIIDEFNPQSVIDVGCGTGALLERFQKNGCTVIGLEYSNAALVICDARGIRALKYDIEIGQMPDLGTYDVAVSVEVAEHLPQACADSYVRLLTSLSGVIVFAAAPPGQGGTDHVNEQPPEYWISKFSEHGFEYSSIISNRWRDAWKSSGKVELWYHMNLLVFLSSADAQ